MTYRRTFFGIGLGCLLLAAFPSCSRESSAPGDKATARNGADPNGPAASKAVSFPTNDAIAYGLRFAAAMSGDEDAVLTQSKAIETVVQACLKTDVDRAFVVAKTIKGWQRGSACADVARSFALAGHSNDSRCALLEAEAWCALYREKTRETSMGWQVGRIRQHIIIARTALGETNAYDMVQQPMDNASPAVVNRLVASDTNRDSSVFLQTLSVILTNKDAEVQQGLSLGILAWAAKQPVLSPQALDEVVAVVKSSLQSQPEQHQFAVQQNLVRLLLANGRRDEAEKLTRELELLVRGMPAGYQRSASLSEMATVWSQIDTNRTALLFDETRQEIARCPASAQSYGYAHLGECLYEMGQTNRAQSVYRDAVEACILMKQGTPRIQRLVETCASMAGAGLPLTPELRNRLEALLAREEAEKR